MSPDTSARAISREFKRWLLLYLGCIFTGGILLFAGSQAVIQHLNVYTSSLDALNCFDLPWDYCWREARWVLRGKIIWALIIVVGGGSVVILPNLLLKEAELRNPQLSYQKQWFVLYLSYYLLGFGVSFYVGFTLLGIVLGGVSFLFFLIWLRDPSLRSDTRWQKWELYKDVVATYRAPQGTVGLTVPPKHPFGEAEARGFNAWFEYFRNEEKILDPQDPYTPQRRRWWGFYLSYLFLGGIIFWVGLRYSLFFLESYRFGCFGRPFSCLGHIAEGVALTATGGGLPVLPHLLQKLAHRLTGRYT